MHRILTGLLALSAIAVGCDDSDFRVERSNDISISPTDVIFPRVVPPQTAVQTVEVRHAGEEPLIVERIYLEGAEGCSLDELGLGEGDRVPEDVKTRCPLVVATRPDLPITLDNQQFEAINIRFQPLDSNVPEGARLVIESNALDKNIQYVNIGFQRAQPQISGPNVVSFAPGVDTTEFLIMQNIGTGPLVVQAPTLTLISEPAINPATGQPEDEFRVSALTAFPWTVNESESETLDIEYSPVDGNLDTADLTFMSSDPQTPSFVIRLTSTPVFGLLEVDPNPISLTVPMVGQSSEKMVTLRNSGVRYVDVTDIAIEQPGEDYRLGGDGQTSYRIAGGSSRTVVIRYQPLGDGSGSSATLNITYDDGNDATQPVLAVPMAPEGTALPAVLNVDPVQVVLDDVMLGETREFEITLTNTGGAALDISRIGLSGDGDPAVPTDPEFMLIAGGDALMLAPAASHTVRLSLARAADDMIVHVGALVIESNAASSPDVISFTSNPPREE